MTWRKDETVKMTLQFYNPALWAGLELYGIFLTCFLLYTLILTALISAMGRLFVIISHNCSHYLFLVMMIAKFEKSKLSIRLAHKMDKMDRTWNWFTNILLRMFRRKVIDLSGRVDGKIRMMMKISCKVVYHLVIAIVAYITTRDQGDYFAESDLSNHETHEEQPFYFKLIWTLIVFLVLSM